MPEPLSSKQKLDKLWVFFTGKPAEFLLRARIYHSVCLIAIPALAYNVPFNYAVGLPKIAFASFLVFAAMCFLYYLSRVKGMFAVAITWTSVIGNVLFTVNYFLNSGIQGPNTLFFALILLLILVIIPGGQYKIWIPLNIFLVMGLHSIEYFYPELVAYTYTSRLSRFVDISSAYMVVVFLTYLCITYMRRNYELERKSAEAKTQAIEAQSQRILSQNQELEKLNEEKNKLMSIIAHDLSSPLGSIQNSLEILTEFELDKKEKLFIEQQLLQTTKDTLAMLSKLLFWSKSQINGLSVNSARLNLYDLLNDTLEVEKSVSGRKKISLEISTEPSVNVMADKDMTELIVRNLVGNAIKFTPSGGHIFVSAAIKNMEGWLVIRDDGIGIPLEKQQNLFSLKGESTYGTENEKGIGLGLQLCKEFVEAQGGRIWFESAPGTGSTFYVALPLYQEPAVQLKMKEVV